MIWKEQFVEDPLPDSFESEEAAGEFWDAHSVEDYAEYFVPVNDEIEITERMYEVQISEDVFKKLQREAEASHQSIPKTLDQILKKELTAA